MNRSLYRALVVLGLFSASGAQAAIITANTPVTGDAFTNAGVSNQGQAIGSSSWYYNNVRNGATVGINTTLPRSGNGSAWFKSEDGADKADFEFLPDGMNILGNFVSTGSLGAFSQLSGFGYDWYRDSSSDTSAALHPVIRVLLDADGNLLTTGDRGGLVFEGVYNGSAAAATNTWVTDSVGASTNLWNFGLGIGFAANINSTSYAYDATLADWKVFFPNAAIIGFSLGVGSGWNDTFNGAVDNVFWTINGQTSSYNFEVARANAVPEPASLALLGGGLLGLMWARRRKA